jgi:TolB-like protein/Flp pilus assembly protein TadD
MSNFFSELKRRNVFKVGVAYAVVAWLLTEIATQVFPFFDIPNWAVRLVILLLILGFPVALIIAWAFELTPEGLKRTEVADVEHLPKRSRKQAWIYVVIIAGAISIGLFYFGHYRTSKQDESAELPEKSIAVLPFENLSRDPDNAYFAEGIQDEILARLAKIADLKVISRTSTQRFKSSPNNLPEIAKQLGVANILEGSVQKSGDQVRVNVQLINAMTDSHLWGDIYDRKLTDIFAVESDIAKTIAETLQAKLTGLEKTAIAKRPTANTEAYELYLKGRFFWNKRTGEALKKSIEYFQQAIEKDSSYALVYAGLADAYVLLPTYSAGSPRESYPKAKAAAKRALEMDETLGEAHASLAYALILYDWDFPESNTEFQRAIELNPNYATAHHWHSIGLRSLGRFDEAIAEMKWAQALDPLSLIINADLGTGYIYARQYDKAVEQLRKTIEMDQSFYYAHWRLGTAYEMKGFFQNAVAEFQRARQLNDDPSVVAFLGHAFAAAAGKREEALKTLDQLKEIARQRYVSGYSFAIVYTGLGEKDQALNELERCYQQRAFDVIFLKIDPLLDNLRGDPRFEALVQKIVSSKTKP